LLCPFSLTPFLRCIFALPFLLFEPFYFAFFAVLFVFCFTLFLPCAFLQILWQICEKNLNSAQKFTEKS